VKGRERDSEGGSCTGAERARERETHRQAIEQDSHHWPVAGKQGPPHLAVANFADVLQQSAHAREEILISDETGQCTI
jgi:hypothetical protein